MSPLRLVRRCFELAPQTDVTGVPARTRGLYVLYRRRPPRGNRRERFDVVYIGIASGERAGIRGRLYKHRRTKGTEWTHFSVFEVWDNIRDDEVKELEGLFRHIYRFDTHANRLNIMKSYKVLTRVRRETTQEHWMKARTDIAGKPRTRRSPKKTSRQKRRR